MDAWIEVAIGVVIRDEKILICRRREETPLGGYWEFPGGKCEPGEPPAACVVRELLEELGVVTRAIETYTVIEHEYSKARVRLHPFRCVLVAGDPSPLAATEIRWVRPHEMSDYPFPPANDSLLKTLRRPFASSAEPDHMLRFPQT